MLALTPIPARTVAFVTRRPDLDLEIVQFVEQRKRRRDLQPPRPKQDVNWIVERTARVLASQMEGEGWAQGAIRTNHGVTRLRKAVGAFPDGLEMNDH